MNLARVVLQLAALFVISFLAGAALIIVIAVLVYQPNEHTTAEPPPSAVDSNFVTDSHKSEKPPAQPRRVIQQ
jgi:hypothetical protein